MEADSGRLARLRRFVRSREAGDVRSRQALLTTLTAFGSRGFGMALSLISVPLTVRYLDPERFGLWNTICSTLAWLSIADLGLGNGLTNAIVKAVAAGDTADEREAISTAFVILLRIALVLGLIFAAVFPFVPWERVYAVSEQIPRDEVRAAVFLIGTLFVLSFPLSVVERVYTGHQQGYIANYWGMVGNVLGLVGLVFLGLFAKGLGWYVAVISGVGFLLRLGNAIQLFVFSRPQLRPRLSEYRPARGRVLLAAGFSFLFAQMAAALMWQTDNIIVAQLFGEEAVGRYAMGMRLYSVALGLISTWLGPLWPAYGDAFARGDLAWVRRSVKRTLRLSMGATVAAGVGMIAIGPQVIRIWTRSDALMPSRPFLAATALNLILTTWCLVHTMPINSLGRMRGQSIYGSTAAILNLGLSILLGKLWGPEGVCWGTCFAAMIPAVGISVELRRALAELTAAEQSEGSLAKATPAR